MSAERRENSRSGVSRFLRWSGIFVGVLALLIVGSAVILPLVFPPEQIKSLIVPRVESALGRDFEAETARVRLIPWPSLRLGNFRVANADGFGPEPAVEGETLDLNLQLFPLIRGEVEINDIELTNPLVRYEVNDQGVSNFEDLGGAEADGRAPLAVTVSNFSAYDASVFYTNRQSNQRTRLSLDIRANAVPEPDANTIASDGTVTIHSVESGGIEAPEEPLTLENLELVYNVTADTQREVMTVDRLAFVSGSFQLEASGVIENMSTAPILDLEIQNQGTNLSGLAALMGTDAGEDVALEGEANFDLQVSGPLDNPTEISIYGPVEVSNAAYAFEMFNQPLRIPEAELRFGGQNLTLDQMLMYFGDNALQLSLQVNDLLAGFLGEGEASDLPNADFQLTSDHLDLTDLYAEMDSEEPGYFDLVQARLANSDLNGQDPGRIAEEFYGDMSVPPVELTGIIKIGEFINPPYSVRELSMAMAVGPDQLAVERVSGQMYEGTISGEVAVELNQEDPPYPTTYQFSLEDASAGAFMEDWTTLGSAVTGTLDYSIDGRTSFDAALLPITEATDADGSAVVTDGGFQDLEIVNAVIERLGINAEALTSFQRLGGPYEVQGGRFLVDGWELGTNTIEGELDGTFGFGGDVDIELGLGMPVSMVQESRLVEMLGGNISSLLGRLAGQDETVEVRLGIIGTMSQPRIEIDTDALQNVLRSLIRGAGQRIPDFLQLR